MKYPLEQAEGEELAKWLNNRKYEFTHVPNETGHSAEAKRRAIRMKRAGTSSGFPDYLIFINGKRIAIELKRIKGPKATPKQKAWLTVLAKHGFHVAICYGKEESVKFIKSVIDKPNVKIELNMNIDNQRKANKILKDNLTF